MSRRFDVLLARIAPSDVARSTAEVRARAIVARLARTMTVSRWLTSGSFYKGAAVARHSDLDLFVALARDEVRWGGKHVASTTVLGNVGRPSGSRTRAPTCARTRWRSPSSSRRAARP